VGMQRGEILLHVCLHGTYQPANASARLKLQDPTLRPAPVMTIWRPPPKAAQPSNRDSAKPLTPTSMATQGAGQRLPPGFVG